MTFFFVVHGKRILFSIIRCFSEPTFFEYSGVGGRAAIEVGDGILLSPAFEIHLSWRRGSTVQVLRVVANSCICKGKRRDQKSRAVRLFFFVVLVSLSY